MCCTGAACRRGADFGEDAVARRMLVGHHADFNQLVADEVLMNCIEHRSGQAGVADHHDGIESVGAGAQHAALGVK